MITLDPEFVGSLVPPSNLTTTTTIDGKSSQDVPFARLPRLERLRIQGKADEKEIDGGDEHGGDDEDPNRKKQAREEREKRKMRGKGKSLKRFVWSMVLSPIQPLNYIALVLRYLRKQRKNVVDPTAVCSFPSLTSRTLIYVLPGRDSSQIREAEGRDTESQGCRHWRGRGKSEAFCFGSVQAPLMITMLWSSIFVSRCHSLGFLIDKVASWSIFGGLKSSTRRVRRCTFHHTGIQQIRHSCCTLCMTQHR